VQLLWEQLCDRHDKDRFNSGVDELDSYLKHQAGQDFRRNLAAVFVLGEETGRIIGYYTLSQDSLTVAELPDSIGRKLPSERKVPCTLLGRLAVDRQYQKHGYGRELLFHALNKVVAISAEVASFAVVIDAKNEQVKLFYQKYGFLSLKNKPLRVFIPVRGIRKMLELWSA
jgi:predicted GNAT family N-acyltransferase